MKTAAGDPIAPHLPRARAGAAVFPGVTSVGGAVPQGRPTFTACRRCGGPARVEARHRLCDSCITWRENLTVAEYCASCGEPRRVCHVFRCDVRFSKFRLGGSKHEAKTA